MSMQPPVNPREPKRDRSHLLGILVGVVVLVLAASGMLVLQQWGAKAAAESPGAGSGLIVKPVPIERITVLLMESHPVQAAVKVEGTLGDGCTTARAPEVSRHKHTFTVIIMSERPKDTFCTLALKLYEETIPLGTVEPGHYTVHVNDHSTSFRVD